ncbi:AraC family transcriptional regulator [Nocardia sp. CA2R105]|uniref:AraC family transcriptional regulator n=1 Tax=Nocardia coffeae TaxID=2873381 RepID=UPI001CA799ED|nr:helix-turn-helix transcriptional regulator [Nocardia coffeae]MBY8862720.1 AraC family transcriptional regulator [Nocardia coffeae]
MVESRQTVLGVGYSPTREIVGSLPVEVLRFPETDVLRGQVRRRPVRPDFHVVGVITGGKGLHAIDFQRLELSAGVVFWLRPGQVHRILGDSGLRGALLLFAPAALAPGTPVAAFAQDGLRPSQWSVDPRDRLAAAALRHLELLLAVDFSTRDGRDALRLALGPLIPAAMGVPGSGSTVFERFAAAVEADHQRHHHVRDYEPIVHASSRTIDRAVRDSRGVGAKRFLDERIALEARRRLATTDVTVAALAAELGFTEPTNFVKFYRRLTGTTPHADR